MLVHEGVLAVLLHKLWQDSFHVPRARQAPHGGLERFLPRFDVFPARVGLDDRRAEPWVLVEILTNVQALNNTIPLNVIETSEECKTNFSIGRPCKWLIR